MQAEVLTHLLREHVNKNIEGKRYIYYIYDTKELFRNVFKSLHLVLERQYCHIY